MQRLYSDLFNYCQQLEHTFDVIPRTRESALLSLSDYIVRKITTDELVQLIVVCTHNSRRSHFGQLWLSIAANYYGISSVQTFSGGTEATAFNKNAVNALKEIGVHITTNTPDLSNPIYDITWQDEQKPYQAFSKQYATPPNPTQQFGAILVCSDADQNCPLIQGCDFRLALPYHDPKQYDGTSSTAREYLNTCQEIGREMLFVFNQVQRKLP